VFDWHLLSYIFCEHFGIEDITFKLVTQRCCTVVEDQECKIQCEREDGRLEFMCLLCPCASGVAAVWHPRAILIFERETLMATPCHIQPPCQQGIFSCYVFTIAFYVSYKQNHCFSSSVLSAAITSHHIAHRDVTFRHIETKIVISVIRSAGYEFVMYFCWTAKMDRRHRQSTCDVTSRRVLANIVTVEKQ
jgi:hypothetical protein